MVITFWHSEPASQGVNLLRLVNRFNSSQDAVRVNPVFQGSPTDLALKLITGLPTGDVPAVASVAEAMTQALADSGQMTPIQHYVDRDAYSLSDFVPSAREYFTVDGSLVAMPYGLLVPLMYYNKVDFREAGLDPDRPPRDLAEMRAVSERLLKRDASGNIVHTGVALDIQPWYVEAMLAATGEPYVDNGNGRQARAGGVMFGGDSGRTLFRWWHDMEAEGLLINVGRSPTGSDQLIAVAARRAAMTFGHSAALRAIVDALEGGVQGTELGVAPLPAIEPGGSQRGGVFARALWIPAGRPQPEQDAAWTFIRWMLEPEQQAEWFAGSGYLPVRPSAYDYPAARDIISRYPEFQVPVDLFAQPPAESAASLGPLLGPFPEVRDTLADGLEAMLSGQDSPDAALAEAVARANAAIRDYNSRLAP